jgi:hypothetical protein
MRVTLEDLSTSTMVISSSVELTVFQALPEATPLAIRSNMVALYFLSIGCDSWI